MTSFNCLSTEIFFEIFDYLSFTDVFHAFFHLQERLNNVIRTYPGSIDLSETTDRDALQHGRFLCRALTIPNVDESENQLDYSNLNCEALRAIHFQYTSLNLVQTIFDQLSVEQLQSIVIKNLLRENDPEDIHRTIWSTIAGQHHLRHLIAPLRILRNDVDELLVVDLPSLQSVVLEQITAEEMLSFLRHTPNLRSFTGRINLWNIGDDACELYCLQLTHLELYIENCNSFDELRQVLSVCPYLTHITLQFWITQNNADMVNAREWQSIVEQCLPDLIHLKIRLFRYLCARNDTDSDSGSDSETFTSSNYWLQRPQFDIRVYDNCSSF